MNIKYLNIILITTLLALMGSACSGNGGGDKRGIRRPCPTKELKVPCYLGPGGNLYQYEKMDKDE